MRSVWRCSVRDAIGGALFATVGAAFLVAAFSHEIGSPGNMGPGFFPMLLGASAVVVGLVILASAIGQAIPFPPIVWRPLVAVLSGIAAFALTIERLGLIPAVLLTVAVSAFGDAGSRFSGAVVLGGAAATVAWLVFSVGLGVNIPAFQWSP